MTTRAQLRTSIRERLEDTSGSPLWTDTALNEFLVTAMRLYGTRVPRPATAATAAVIAGATSVALPAGVVETAIVAVCDGSGRDVPPATERFGPAPADASSLIQAWRVWAGTLRLQRPVAGDESGVWTIDYLSGRELIADDVSPQLVEPGDAPIVIALAAVQALERRAIEDVKRSTKSSPADGLAARLRDEAERLIAARKRRVRGGYLDLA